MSYWLFRAVLALAFWGAVTAPALAGTERLLYAFAGAPKDGAFPFSSPTLGPSGIIYGITEHGGGSGNCPNSPAGCGTVFALFPGASGRYTEKLLYSFQGGQDGAMPFFGLLLDGAGNLYGMTQAGGGGACPASGSTAAGCGTVFKLTPPAAGKTAWTETVIYRFQGGAKDGSGPASTPLSDATGALYGVTDAGGPGSCAATATSLGGCGVVFKLAPPAAGKTVWTRSIIYSFKSAKDGYEPSGLMMDSDGSLFGQSFYGGSGSCAPPDTPKGCGTVYRLVPSAQGGGAWTKTTLHNFAGGSADGAFPSALSLLTDAQGVIYGITAAGGSGNCPGVGAGDTGCGTVFSLTPPAPGKTAWAAKTLYSFAGGSSDTNYPIGAILFDSSGSIVGAGAGLTQGSTTYGAVFKLAPPTGPSKSWKESIVFGFHPSATSGLYPSGGVVADSSGALYGTTLYGPTSGASCFSCGAVFKVTP